MKQAEKLNPEQKQVRLMKELQDLLHLPKMPYQIECFDNSNISGSDAVAACVVFKKMKPSKQDYRKYNIKTVVGPDDYASMKEVVWRRYHRLIEEQEPLPDLIVADGGKGQMEVIRQAVQDELGLDIPIAGLAKNDRHRTNELLYGFPPRVIGIKDTSELFRVLTQLQDEVHRFAITFHREKRSKHALHSELDDIKGIGPKAKEKLLKGLKTVKNIKEAEIEQLAELIGQAKAVVIYQYFHGEEAKEADETKEADEAKGADETKEADETKGADETKEADETKGDDEAKSSEGAKGVEKDKKREIGQGFLILLGVCNEDTMDDVEWLVKKITNLRVFDDENHVMNRSIIDIKGEVLVVSQFTLYASYKKGNRPSWFKAGSHEHSIPLYEAFCKGMEEQLGKQVGTGEFGADMKVELVNDGPVTICMDTKNKE